MAQEYNETTPRPKRDPDQIRRALQRRQAKTMRLLTLCAVLTVCCLVLVVIIIRGGQPQASTPENTTTAPTESTTLPATSENPTQPPEPDTVIRLVFGGDLNITDKVVAAGTQDGRYDYTKLLMDVAPLLADADATFLNLEGNFCGVPYGTGSASAPPELAAALKNAGVDFLQLANSYSIYNGLTGLSTTVNTLRSTGILPLGVFVSEAEQSESQGFTLVNIGGIRVAIVAFTKGMDGMSLPSGSEGCVNLLYTDYATTYQKVDEVGIRRVLQAAAAQQPDITIALVHWGSEFNDTISPTQQAIATMMQEEGVDAIVGTHSHFVQKIEYDPTAGTVIAWSLGDFLGDAEKSGTNYSILLQLEITRNNQTGQTTISACDYTGLYVLTPEKDEAPLQILRIDAVMTMYESNHIHKVSAQAYSNICYALERIQARTKYPAEPEP